MNKLPEREHFSISALYRDNCATVRGRTLCVRLCTKTELQTSLMRDLVIN